MSAVGTFVSRSDDLVDLTHLLLVVQIMHLHLVGVTKVALSVHAS